MEYKLVALPDTSNSWETNDLTEDELNFKPDNTPIEIEPNDRSVRASIQSINVQIII